ETTRCLDQAKAREAEPVGPDPGPAAGPVLAKGAAREAELVVLEAGAARGAVDPDPGVVISEAVREAELVDLEPGVAREPLRSIGNSSLNPWVASGVLGQYLVMQGDKQEFTTWMKETTSANSKQANDCYDGLNKWTQEFL
ncbi:hypothetical protein NQ315_002125, partial [Exocentrus adspersus]